MSPGIDLTALVRDHGDPQGEALACRSDCALFDFSFVRRVRLRGAEACAGLEALCARPLADLAPNRIRLALRRSATGHLVSDLTVWRTGPEGWEVMTGNPDDLPALAALPGAMAEGDGADRAIFAVQGPRALAALAPLCDAGDLAGLAYFAHAPARMGGIDCVVGRLGYSGEAGAEILCAAADGPALWSALAAHVRPAGFAAADILRIEAGLALFCNEFLLPVTAAEAGLAAFAPLVADPEPRLARICLTAEGAGPVLWQPPRRTAHAEARLLRPGDVVVTSACHSPLAGGCLVMGYARREDLAAGRALGDPSGHFRGLRRVGLPLHDPERGLPRTGWTTSGT